MPLNQITAEKDVLPLTTVSECSSYGLAISRWGRLARAFNASFYEPNPDQLEQWLMVDPSQAGFLRDYGKLKKQPGKEIIECLTRYYVFDTPLPSSSANISEETHCIDEIHQPNVTFSKALDDFSAKIRPRSHQALQICLLSLKSPDTLRSKLFMFKDKAFCSVQHLNKKYGLPSLSILSIVEKEWDPGWHQAKSLSKNPFFQDSSHARRPCKLPSKVSTPHQLAILERGTERSIVELNLVTSAPSYRGDFYEYVWQRQNSLPHCERVVFFTSQSGHLGSRNVFITIDSDAETTDGNRCAELLLAFHRKLAQLPQLSSEKLAADEIEITYISTLLAALSIVADSTNDFVNDGLQSIMDLQYQGRRSPSGSKLHYLSHLGDYRQTATKTVHHALDLLSNLKSSIHISTDKTPLQTGLSEIEGDLMYLKAKLDEMAHQIIILRSMLKEKLDLRQIRRTFILTVLAAIYLPFSFMATLYGMNLSDPIWPADKRSVKHSSKHTVRDTVPPLDAAFYSEQTKAIVTAVQHSGAHLWSFKSYWYITVPVTITTIIVPLIIGSIFRSLSRFAFDYRGYWRIIVILSTITLVGMINNLFAGGDIWLLVFTLCLGLPAIFFTAKAFLRRKHRTIWIGYTLSIVAHILIWNFLYLNQSMGVIGPFIPLAYLLLVWFRHDIAYFYRRVWNFATSNRSTSATGRP